VALGRSSDQRLAALLLQFPDTHALGLQAAQGLVATETFFWDLDDATCAWTKRFLARNGGKPPSMIHAGTYGATLRYLKAAAGTTDATDVVAKMKELPIDDFYSKGTVREDGRVMRPYYLLQVTKPSESKYPFDHLKLLATVPAEEAARPPERERVPVGEAWLRWAVATRRLGDLFSLPQGRMSPYGPTRTSCDVCFIAAIGGIADVNGVLDTPRLP